MGSNTVEFTLPNTDKVWTVEKAGPGANGDYAEAYSMRVGIGKAGELMVDAAKELNGYSAEVEWDAYALETIQTLSGKIQDWATTPPTAQDLLALYGSTLIQGTPDQVKMAFTTILPQVYVDQGYTTTNTTLTGYGLVKVDMEDIKRVPPEYPNWKPSGSDAGIYARPDGTYFSLFWAPSNPPPAPPPGPPGQIVIADPNWDWKYTWQEWDIDPAKTALASQPDLKTLLPTWIDSLDVTKSDLTRQSQTQTLYLQNITEQYDRMLSFLQGLLDSLKKLLESLVSKQ